MTNSIAAWRLATQRLAGEPSSTPSDLVRHLVAVQAQDYGGAKWGIGQRTAAATDAELDALLDAGTLIRTHVLRPTWHLVRPSDVRWLLSLTAPRVRATVAAHFRRLELDEPVLRRSRRALERALVGGRSLTSAEAGSALEAAGIPTTGLRRSFLLFDAELAGLVCSGPCRGRRQTYALLDERVPPAMTRPRDEALAELAGRFVAGHGPAQAVDVAWWSGLTVTDARRALELAGNTLDREQIGDRTFWVALTAPSTSPRSAISRERGRPVIRLLPNYDELLVAFRDRSDAVDSGLPAGARTSATLLGHVVVRDGLVVGTWKPGTSSASTSVAVTPLVSLDEADRAAIHAEADRMARFLNRPLEVTFAD